MGVVRVHVLNLAKELQEEPILRILQAATNTGIVLVSTRTVNEWNDSNLDSFPN